MMIGTIDLKFLIRETVPWTGSVVREARLKFPHEQHSESDYCHADGLSVGVAGSYPLTVSGIHGMLESESWEQD